MRAKLDVTINYVKTPKKTQVRKIFIGWQDVAIATMVAIPWDAAINLF